MLPPVHRTPDELAPGIDHIRQAPADGGPLALIVRRPSAGERELLTEAELDLTVGLVGDYWLAKGSRRSPDGAALPDAQIAIMNSRVIATVTGGDDHDLWALAGDQLYLDLDLSAENLPTGTRVALGDTVLQITDHAHNGCVKFAARFGKDALRFVNIGADARHGRYRGIFARIVQPGTIRTGDRARKL
jgi:hypothetical protein